MSIFEAGLLEQGLRGGAGVGGSSCSFIKFFDQRLICCSISNPTCEYHDVEKTPKAKP